MMTPIERQDNDSATAIYMEAFCLMYLVGQHDHFRQLPLVLPPFG